MLLCIILNINKTRALAVSRSRTVNPSHGNFVLTVASICASPNVKNPWIIDVAGSPLKTMCVALSRICILRLEWVFVDTSVQLRCY